ncbi:MAG TPA: hypothetical protein VMF30_08490 [Pirellulales bacterium]|nr:hypothetical protein [Pirellulales bacterium]
MARFFLLLAIVLVAWVGGVCAKQPRSSRVAAPPRSCPPCATAQASAPSTVLDPETKKSLANRAAIDAEIPRANARGSRINAELAALDRNKLADDDWAKEWAGNYFEGDGLGRNVHIDIVPRAGVVYKLTGCGAFDVNHGEVVETFPDGVKANLAVDPRFYDDRIMSSRLYFVRWGNQRFLVPAACMITLVNNYNLGGYRRRAMPGIPRRDGKVVFEGLPDEPPGRPELPAEFARLIVDMPTRAKVIDVKMTADKKGQYGRHVEGDVTIDAGRDKRFFEGMAVGFPEEVSRLLISISHVDDHTSTGSFVCYSYQEAGPPVTVGMEIGLPGAKPAADARAGS